MKKIYLLILFTSSFIFTQAQDSKESIMVKRAKEMHRIINLNNKQEWINFIKDNYTQALIDKQQTMKVQSNEDGRVSKTQEVISDEDKLEAKAKMFARLHEDFSGSRLVSIQSHNEILEMVLDNGEGLIGTFKLTFEKNKPYKIDGLGITAGN
jgi:hypothetical protein